MARRVATLSPLSAPVAAPPPTAALLFAAANAARRSGDRMAAVKLYRQLQQLYPASEEAIASLVSSADNHVRIDQPAEALVDLDRYLAERPAGTLAPEALFVRARCLSALRRPDDERAAWGQLLQRFPGSLYEATARRRLDELRR
jgi:outer membrane protein assembly factor BamD (BamD/ComL family)